ncbi:suppressor of fused domain protein [Micromonospora sp. CPCC 205539]|uniref:suppressor of fused domain protein n=1 Tax=Micromonospora sp. CPCC 205539 TaxID=3122408 RepID=UPI002FF2556D
MWATADETREEIVGLYRRAAAHADATIEALALDDVGRVPWWGDESVTLPAAHRGARGAAPVPACFDLSMTSDAPGWEAIDARLDVLYPDVEPKHYGTLHRFALGGPDPLDGISFYPRDSPVSHWHIVSYGMSELYAKESDNPEESGWGFEFTFRVTRDIEDTDPPMWAANMLQNLARYVYSSGNWFESGHHMDANGPIWQDYETAVTALAFVEDPELGTIPTPHGQMQFLQVVGLTGDEYEAVQQWTTEGVLGLLAERAPLLVTDLDRPSLTDDAAVRAVIEAGRAHDDISPA